MKPLRVALSIAAASTVIASGGGTASGQNADRRMQEHLDANAETYNRLRSTSLGKGCLSFGYQFATGFGVAGNGDVTGQGVLAQMDFRIPIFVRGDCEAGAADGLELSFGGGAGFAADVFETDSGETIGSGKSFVTVPIHGEVRYWLRALGLGWRVQSLYVSDRGIRGKDWMAMTGPSLSLAVDPLSKSSPFVFTASWLPAGAEGSGSLMVAINGHIGMMNIGLSTWYVGGPWSLFFNIGVFLGT